MSAASSSRRTFIKKTTLAGIAATGISNIQLLAASNFKAATKESQLTFLFQGDSITDGNRGRNKDPNHIMGHGYAFSIASRLGASFPGKANVFFNRGISGNRVTDLAKRWQADTLDIKPDVLSILVGVNDTDSVVRKQNIVTVEKYEETYRSLLTQTRTQFPGCLLVLCEPFLLPVGRIKENWSVWSGDMQKRQMIASRLSKEFDTVFVPLQKVFTDATSLAAADYWIWDGIHPTCSGHELITREWLKQVSKRLHFLNAICF
jgi:lysophospholipase L1-like esterase